MKVKSRLLGMAYQAFFESDHDSFFILLLFFDGVPVLPASKLLPLTYPLPKIFFLTFLPWLTLIYLSFLNFDVNMSGSSKEGFGISVVGFLKALCPFLCTDVLFFFILVNAHNVKYVLTILSVQFSGIECM